MDAGCNHSDLHVVRRGEGHWKPAVSEECGDERRGTLDLSASAVVTELRPCCDRITREPPSAGFVLGVSKPVFI